MSSTNIICYYCSSCYYCSYCSSCSSCNYSRYLRMSEYMIFCLGNEEDRQSGIGYQKNTMAFNKSVSKERYYEIKNLIMNDILENLELELYKNSWEDEWKKVTREQWLRMKNEIPEFDQEVVEGIIGFELDLESDDVEITVEGQTKTISRKSAIALGLLNKHEDT